MCQGLPCVGHPVELIRTLLVEGVELSSGLVGTVSEEHLLAREVTVYFPALGQEFRLAETDLKSGSIQIPGY